MPTYRCPRCQRTDSAPIKLCRCGYNYSRDSRGARLRRILGNRHRTGCGCSDAAALIDRWGVEKSRKNKQRLVKMITRKKRVTQQEAINALNTVLA